MPGVNFSLDMVKELLMALSLVVNGDEDVKCLIYNLLEKLSGGFQKTTFSHDYGFIPYLKGICLINFEHFLVNSLADQVFGKGLKCCGFEKN